MKTILLVLALFLMTGNLQAATLEWDRNLEPDMKDYLVYACFTPSCVLVKSLTTLQVGPVLQTATGIRPSFVIDLTNRQGNIAVSARDQSNNESGLSVSVPFDQVSPSIPVNPMLR